MVKYIYTLGVAGGRESVTERDRTAEYTYDSLELHNNVIAKKVTTNHPFYVEDKGWVAAGDLEIGDVLYTVDGDAVEVTDIEIERLAEPVNVYNRDVADFDTYFVGEYGILVHNYERLPQKDGKWSGAPGNSTWNSTNPKVNRITKDEGIPFNNGRPDFSKWVSEILEFGDGKLNGTRNDFSLVYEAIRDIKGFKSKAEAKRWLKSMKLTPHHFSNTIIQLVPTDLHANIPHVGSASDLRGLINSVL